MNFRWFVKESKWFTKESKSFMGYGTYTPKLSFWAQFPFAYMKFMYYSVQDWHKNRVN